MKGRSLLSLMGFSTEEIRHLLDLAREDKAEKRRRVFPKRLENRNIALVFLKPSARTRMSFVFRGFEHESLVELAEYGGVPVWNGLYDVYHPTQVLADLMTIDEVFGRLDVPVTYVGDGRNNMSRSLIIGAAKMGFELRILAPPELQPSPEFVARAMSAPAPGAR